MRKKKATVDPLEELEEFEKRSAQERHQLEMQHLSTWKENGKQPEHLAPLLRMYEPVVQRKVRQYKAPTIPESAFKAEIHKHMIRAFETYDPNRQTQLNTHVENTLRRAIRYNAQHQNFAHMSEGQIAKIGPINRAREQLVEDLGRDPSHEEIAQHMNMSVRRVKNIISAQRKDIPDSAFPGDPDDALRQASRDREVLSLLEHELNPQEKQVFNHLFGLNGARQIDSTNELAKTLGKSAPQVSRLRSAILNKYQQYKLEVERKERVVLRNRPFYFLRSRCYMNLIEAAFTRGQSKLDALLKLLKETVITDYLADPRSLSFSAEGGVLRIALYSADKLVSESTIHPHALQQLCTKVQLPKTFVNRLLSDSATWKKELVVHNLNTLFFFTDFGEEPRFLFRIVNGQLRGFLSRRFKRHLSSEPLATAFMFAAILQGAGTVDAYSTGVKNTIRVALPRVHNPFDKEEICIGAQWANSDFGQGMSTVELGIWKPNSGHFMVVHAAMARRHVGSVIQESDLEVGEETAVQDVQAQQAATQEAVNSILTDEVAESIVDAIKAAAGRQVPWTELTAILNKNLGKIEGEQVAASIKEGSVLELPPIDKEGMVNNWWMCQLFTLLADKELDVDKKQKLEQLSGKLLNF